MELHRKETEAIENKADKRNELEDQIQEFLSRGGKIEEVPYGVGVDSEIVINRDARGLPVSGIDGIVWDEVRSQWKVLAAGRKSVVGFTDSVTEALTLKRQYHKKMKTLKGRTE